MLSQFKIGHYTNSDSATGCTVILPPDDVVASASVRGASPGTRELELLSPKRKISSIQALLLTGGSAFGLNAAQGVVEYLEERNIGYKTHYGIVPIVPAAVIFDLNIGDAKVRPTAADARLAAENAKYNNRMMGNIGAGTGATVGKWNGIERAMKGGLGISEITHGALKVAVVAVVNAVGDVIDKNGKILAGAIDVNNRFIANDNPHIRWGKPDVGLVENTVLCAVMTNAAVSKQQAHYLADRAHNGIARRIDPAHTSYDGDVTFVLAKPEKDADIDVISSMTVEAVEIAILEAVKNADPVFGFKSYKNL